MAKFCTRCGRPLKEGEVCTCSTQQGQQAQQPNYQQGQQAQQQNYQQGQQAQQPNYQQGQQAQQQNYQQGQQAQQQNYQQGQPGGQQYYQQGQPGGQQYYQQGQPGGQQYYQQGPTKEMEWLNRQKDVIVSGTKSMFSELGPILKAPVSRVRKICESNNPAIGIEFIVAKTIVCLVVVIIAMLVIAAKIRQATGGYVDVPLPYFQMFLLTLILTAGVDFLESVMLKVFSGVFGGRTSYSAMMNVIGARCIYDTFVFLVVVILGMMAVEVALGALVLLSPISIFIQYGAYTGCVQQMNEDRKPYAYFMAKLCMSVITFIVVYLLARSYIGGVISQATGGLF